jgi:4-carboxymuconolactone decarboxylase
MPPIPADLMTPAQRDASERVSSGPRGGLYGPFVPLLRAPGLMDRLQAVGSFLRYHGTLPRDAFELTVLIVARAWDQQFEWTHHHPLAVAAGISEASLDAIAHGQTPPGLTATQSDAYSLVTDLLRNRAVSDEIWAAAVTRFGEEGVIEMVSAVGYYSTLAMIMNAARTPVSADASPLLPALDRR